MTDSFKKAIEDAKKKLLRLVDQRDTIGTEIERTKNAIEALAYMLDNPDETATELADLNEIIGPRGMTDAISRILQSTAAPLTPVEVKESLSSTGFDLTNYSNALASIHTILKRLGQTENVEVTNKDGKTAYVWKGIRRFPRRNLKRARAFAGIK
jgi:hypothetical protein